jgi:Fur family peroxide stress response transcriptional regulator
LLKILVPNSSDHYDSRTDLHYHFYCECCEKIYDVPFKNEKVVDDFPLGMKRQGFKMKSCNLLFMGTCPNCSKKD